MPRAVSFAASMIRDGEYVGKAVKVASAYYRVSYDAVQSGLSERSGKSQRGAKKPVVTERCSAQIDSHDGNGMVRCSERAVARLEFKSGYHKNTIGFCCENEEHYWQVDGMRYTERGSDRNVWKKLRQPTTDSKKPEPKKPAKPKAPNNPKKIAKPRGASLYGVGMKMNKRQ